MLDIFFHTRRARTFAIVFTVLFLTIPAVLVADEKHSVVFQRTTKVGGRLAVSAIYEQQIRGGYQNWAKGMQVPIGDGFVYSILTIKGVLKVLEVNKSGQFVKGSLAIEQLFWHESSDRFGEDGPPNLIAVHAQRGKRLLLRWDGSAIEIMECNVKRFPERHKEALLRILSDMTRNFSAQRYGPAKPRRVGEKWPVKVDEQFVSELLPVKPDRGKLQFKDTIAGNVILVTRSDISGVDCLELLATTEGKDFIKTFQEDKMRVGTGNVKETFRFLLPVNPKSLFRRSRRVRKWSATRESVSDDDVKGFRISTRYREALETWVTEIER